MDRVNSKPNTPSSGEEIVLCKNCGAEFSSSLPNCPYCGRMYLPAAEDAYMGKLEDMRTDLQDLADLPARESRKHFRTLLRKLLIPVIVLALILLTVGVIRLVKERKEALAEREEILWQRTGFAEMDELYSAGDYDALADRYMQASVDGHNVWNYKRSAFCESLLQIREAEEARKDVEAGDGSLSWLMLNELYLYRQDSRNGLSDAERLLLEEMRAPLLEDLEQRFSLTPEELRSFRDTLRRDGYLSYDACADFLKGKGMTE